METFRNVFERTLSPEDSKQNLPFQVEVPSGTQVINLRLDYSPLQVEGINNLLTLTVFGPEGFRGAGHRHPSEYTAFIGSRSASPGFLPGPITPGLWTIVLDVHMVMPGPPCRMRLDVSGSDEERAAPAARPAHATRRPARGPGWYRGDVHAHSIHSDAAWDIPDLIAWARAHHLDFCALTDHNTVSGLPEMLDSSADDLLTIPGMELTTFWGHALALGIRDWIDWRVREGERSIEQIAAEVEARGGLLIIAHPRELGDPYCTGCEWSYPTMMPGTARVVEVWNGGWESESHSEAGLGLVYEWLNQGYRLVLTSGNDNHGHNPDAVGYAFDNVYADELSESAVLRAIRAGHLYISSGPRLMLGALVAGPAVMPGDVLSVPRGTSVQIAGSWQDAPERAELALVVDGEEKERQVASGTGSRTWDLRGGQARWCLLTLRDENGQMLALTNPIYLDGRS